MKHLIFIILLSPAARADVPELMNRLITLRADLETANREMEADLKQRQSELDLWTQKKLELEGQLQKESLRKLQIDEKIARLSLRVKIEGKQNPKALPEFQRWLKQAHDWVNFSLPFRRDQRLAVLDGLKERAARGLESVETLSGELWMFYESELKMAADNEFRITELPDGKAEVARLGLYALFAKTADGRVQQAEWRDGAWAMADLPDGETRDNALRLINNMKAKKDSGLYQLPIERGAEKL